MGERAALIEKAICEQRIKSETYAFKVKSACFSECSLSGVHTNAMLSAMKSLVAAQCFRENEHTGSQAAWDHSNTVAQSRNSIVSFSELAERREMGERACLH